MYIPKITNNVYCGLLIQQYFVRVNEFLLVSLFIHVYLWEERSNLGKHVR